MIIAGNDLILEGREVPAFRHLLSLLVGDLGVMSAQRKVWRAYPELDGDSKGAVSAAATRALSAFCLMRQMRPEIPQVVLIADSIERAGLVLNHAAPVSHRTNNPGRPMVVPDPKTGIAGISGVARPVGRFRGLRTTATLISDSNGRA